MPMDTFWSKRQSFNIPSALFLHSKSCGGDSSLLLSQCQINAKMKHEPDIGKTRDITHCNLHTFILHDVKNCLCLATLCHIYTETNRQYA